MGNIAGRVQQGGERAAWSFVLLWQPSEASCPPYLTVSRLWTDARENVSSRPWGVSAGPSTNATAKTVSKASTATSTGRTNTGRAPKSAPAKKAPDMNQPFIHLCIYVMQKARACTERLLNNSVELEPLPVFYSHYSCCCCCLWR